MTGTENPYAPPLQDPSLPAVVDEGLVLASRGERFLGAIVDGLINMVLVVLLFLAFMATGVVGNFADLDGLSFIFSLLFSLLAFAGFIGINWVFLSSTGQTIGKKAASTRIVTMEGTKPNMTDLVLKRYAFFNLINLIPLVGGILSLVNILFIFRADKRCLHDLIAGTQVVKSPPAAAE